MNIEKILAEAPEGATHWNEFHHYLRAEKSGYMTYDPFIIEWDYEYAGICDTRSLDDLREIQRLRAENEALKTSIPKIKAEAGRGGYMRCAEDFGLTREGTYQNGWTAYQLANAYANQIETAAKEA